MKIMHSEKLADLYIFVELQIGIYKVRDTKGTFHAKMGSIKDRNGMDLTETEDLKKRWKNTQNYTKKIFTTQITTTV